MDLGTISFILGSVLQTTSIENEDGSCNGVTHTSVIYETLVLNYGYIEDYSDSDLSF